MMESTRCRILIVEDDAFVTLDLRDLLEDRNDGRAVDAANSVAGALSRIQDEPPDCAVLDVNLCHEMSWPVADALAKRHIPFLFVSGHSRAVLPHEHRERPFLNKPYIADDLFRAVSQLLDQIARRHPDPDREDDRANSHGG